MVVINKKVIDITFLHSTYNGEQSEGKYYSQHLYHQRSLLKTDCSVMITSKQKAKVHSSCPATCTVGQYGEKNRIDSQINVPPGKIHYPGNGIHKGLVVINNSQKGKFGPPYLYD